MYIAIDRETGLEYHGSDYETFEMVEEHMEWLGVPRSHYYILQIG